VSGRHYNLWSPINEVKHDNRYKVRASLRSQTIIMMSSKEISSRHRSSLLLYFLIKYYFLKYSKFFVLCESAPTYQIAMWLKFDNNVPTQIMLHYLTQSEVPE